MTILLGILFTIIGYLVGSIPFGLVISQRLNLGDLRKIGSGNIGATNVLRTGNKGAAAATLILDAAKGAVVVLVARAVAGEGAALVAGLAAFIGHLFPIWAGFKGGKGVATFLGVLLAVSFPAGLMSCLVWLACAAVWRISSLAALAAAALAPTWLALFGRFDALWLGLAMAVLVWIRHAANIRRIIDRVEPRIGGDKISAEKPR